MMNIQLDQMLSEQQIEELDEDWEYEQFVLYQMSQEDEYIKQLEEQE